MLLCAESMTLMTSRCAAPSGRGENATSIPAPSSDEASRSGLVAAAALCVEPFVMPACARSPRRPSNDSELSRMWLEISAMVAATPIHITGPNGLKSLMA